MTDDLYITTHPVLGVTPAGAATVCITVDGRELTAGEGEILAVALWRHGVLALGHNPASGAPRGMYCGIGHCCECRVTIDGVPDVRSCLVPVRQGMAVSLDGRSAGEDNDGRR